VVDAFGKSYDHKILKAINDTELRRPSTLMYKTFEELGDCDLVYYLGVFRF
jgi:hypothetical protein